MMDALSVMLRNLEELARRDVPYLGDPSFRTDPPILPAPAPLLPFPPSNDNLKHVMNFSQADRIRQGQYDNLPVVRVPDGVTQGLCPIGYLNGQMVYAIQPVLSPPPLAADPQRSSSTTKRRKRRNQHEDGRPYVKKPPNAFMLFMKEQRAILQEQFDSLGSREVCTMLGEMWKAMSNAEQDKYYQESYRLKRLHYQQHPDWVPNSIK